MLLHWVAIKGEFNMTAVLPKFYVEKCGVDSNGAAVAWQSCLSNFKAAALHYIYSQDHLMS